MLGQSNHLLPLCRGKSFQKCSRNCFQTSTHILLEIQLNYLFSTQKRFLSPKCIHRMTWVKNNAFLLDPEWLSSLREKTHSRPYWTVSELHERSPPPQQTASWSSSRRIWNGLGVREVIILGSRLSWTPGQHFPLCLSAKVSFWSATLNLGWCMCFLNLSAEFTPSLILGI